MIIIIIMMIMIILIKIIIKISIAHTMTFSITAVPVLHITSVSDPPEKVDIHEEYLTRKKNGDTKMELYCDVSVSNPASTVIYPQLDRNVVQEDAQYTNFSKLNGAALASVSGYIILTML